MATILVVDDDPVTRRILGTQLRKAGHAAIAAGSAESALQLLSATHCDLAILDIGLPDIDGLALLRMLRARDDCSAMPIIMLTASGQDEDSTKAGAAGANAFLLKPTSSNELISTVSRLLGQA
jgi:DNA-binding response OmpR family regulator